jgi:hypothetical protein
LESYFQRSASFEIQKSVESGASRHSSSGNINRI